MDVPTICANFTVGRGAYESDVTTITPSEESESELDSESSEPGLVPAIDFDLPVSLAFDTDPGIDPLAVSRTARPPAAVTADLEPDPDPDP